MVGYLKVHWHHELPDEPVWLFSELDDERYEVRKVEVYRDGARAFADAERRSGTSMLGEIPAPGLDEFAELEEFTACEIDRDEFEEQWSAAVNTDQGGKSPR